MGYDARKRFLNFINDSMGSVNCRIDCQMVESWGVKKIFMLEDSGLSAHGTGILTTLNQPIGRLLLTALCYNPADISNGRMVLEAVVRTHREDERFSKFEVCVDFVSDNTEIQSVAAEVGFSRIRVSEDGWTLFSLQPSKRSNLPESSESSKTSSNSRGIKAEDQSTGQELLIKMQHDFNDEDVHYTRFRKKNNLRSKETIYPCSNENMSDASTQNNISRIATGIGHKPESPTRLTHSSSSKFSCESCAKTFSVKSNLKRHIRTVHEKLRPFVCEICDKTFTEKNNLMLHIGAVHEKLSTLSCESCDKTFSSKGNLKRHIRTVHEKLRPFICEICDKKAATKSNLIAHIRFVHEKIRPFLCQLCDMKFSYQTDLQRHVSSVHEKLRPFVCDLCGKKFSTNTCIQRHTSSVHKKPRI
eukprot:907926_1